LPDIPGLIIGNLIMQGYVYGKTAVYANGFGRPVKRWYSSVSVRPSSR